MVVTDVYPDTPAARSGLKSGDVIRTFAGVKVDSPRELQLLVERAEVGRPHEMELVRNGKSMTLNFVPELQPGDFEAKAAGGSASESSPSESSGFEALGMELSDLSPAVARQLGVKEQKGVVITAVSPVAWRTVSAGHRHGDYSNQPPAGRNHCRCPEDP